ncbi:hypothetical protein CORI_2013 [Campylobacter sp. CCUG 57310]|nr:hypothetical protein CORI_2013 [Campylobacter sp. CCUG 57310]
MQSDKIQQDLDQHPVAIPVSCLNLLKLLLEIIATIVNDNFFIATLLYKLMIMNIEII